MDTQIGYYVLLHRTVPSYLSGIDNWPRRYPTPEAAMTAGKAWAEQRMAYEATAFCVVKWDEKIGGKGMLSVMVEKTDCQLATLTEVANELRHQQRLKSEGRFRFTCADAEITEMECCAVLGEEFGEVCHEVNETIGGHKLLDRVKLRKELIQVAAVALAWVDGLDNARAPIQGKID